jgi:hypothetical protein
MRNKFMKFTKQHQLYESEITRFIKDLKKNNPDIEVQQKIGRALLWDKMPIDLDTQKRLQESRVKQQPYVYQSKS